MFEEISSSKPVVSTSGAMSEAGLYEDQVEGVVLLLIVLRKTGESKLRIDGMSGARYGDGGEGKALCCRIC